ncbi:hypothetical protein ACLF3G_26165 [Falsiroseomonas sp. HC035]|uniref:hypothetical protein n=1 Tax=Falsiroseomonas sp. HC035 TaxID=3390999 RepID=UPI003D312DEE
MALDDQPVDMPLALLVNGRRLEAKQMVMPRRDLEPAFGECHVRLGFRLTAVLRLSPFEYPTEIIVRPEVPDDLKPLPIHRDATIHSFTPAMTTVQGFWRHIQNPASRERHDGTLSFMALRALARFRRQRPLQAAALCVLIWRDLLSTEVVADAARIDRFGRYLLELLSSAGDELSVRWYVSMANALAFLRYKRGDIAGACWYFERVVYRTEAFSCTWLCAPNGLSARFMLGYLALIQKDEASCLSHMNSVVAFYKERLAFAEVANTWSLDEVTEATRLTQQAFQIAEMLREGTKSPRLNAGSDFEPNRISTQLIALFFSRGLLPVIKLADVVGATGFSQATTSHRAPDGKEATEAVLIGRERELFLGGGANQLRDQLTGRMQLTKQQLADIAQVHAERRSIMQAGVHGGYVHIIAPNKETALSHLLPADLRLQQFDLTPVNAYLESVASRSHPTVYRPHLMRRLHNSERSYYRTDTHWTHHGTINYVAHALEIAGMPEVAAAIRAVPGERFAGLQQGDLGVKLRMPPEDISLIRPARPNGSQVFTNGIVNDGSVRLFRNKQPLINEKLLMLHDSMGTWSHSFCAEVFSEVLAIHCPDLDAEYLKKYKPKYLLFVQVERFFIRVPNNGISFKEMVAQKEQEKSAKQSALPVLQQLIELGAP